MDPAPPNERYLILANISKLNNIVQLCFTAAAHNFTPIIVGIPSIENSFFNDLRPSFSFLRFDTLTEAAVWLTDHGITTIGIEIMESAVSYLTFQYPSKLALMPGNEGTGLSLSQKSICQNFVFIPQSGAGTASLNVHVAVSLVLHGVV